ncbi:MAG: radical SAM protein [Candidatus Nanoarchaeia archaeon]|nr:radical SAM protein [Candidatus Haiyanarchaeum thermophilum]MCW1303049.1 radical SAM protein [Candidatus Haiyanarchaeum thermophilum]MCW1304132.1 radical SAM protein [Candidatus Haiyanarchaeum thermophilum]MCW1306841.1 radical SAM protein [Candidatus Haiyanarchaeum thermophilum]MCW1307083.1 radical SAM protein [Candidatus Haiyanarchaeum thermophilum]
MSQRISTKWEERLRRVKELWESGFYEKMDRTWACCFPIRERKKKVLWEITNKCNSNCRHCCSNASREGMADELSFEEIIEIIDELSEWGIKEVYFSGGEPLVKERILEILKYARRKFEILSFATNGLALDEKIAEEIREIAPNYVGVSIDHFIPEKHDEIRGVKGAFQKTCEGVRKLLKYGINVRIGCVITKDNYEYTEEMIKMAINLGAPAILFVWLQPIGRAVSDDVNLRFGVPIAEYLSVAKILWELKEKYETSMQIEVMFRRFPLKFLPLEECRGGSEFFYIKANGAVGPCPWISKQDEKYLVDGLRKFSFSEIVNSQPFKEFRELIKRRAEIEKCSKCEFRDKCGLGCPGITKLWTGSYYSPDPICELFRK